MPSRSRIVLSYSMLFRRCATTRPGLIGPVAPGGSTVDPVGPLVGPTFPVQPAIAATAAIAAPATIRAPARARLHEGKSRGSSTTGGIGRRFLSYEYAAGAGSVCP